MDKKLFFSTFVVTLSFFVLIVAGGVFYFRLYSSSTLPTPSMVGNISVMLEEEQEVISTHNKVLTQNLVKTLPLHATIPPSIPKNPFATLNIEKLSKNDKNETKNLPIQSESLSWIKSGEKSAASETKKSAGEIVSLLATPTMTMKGQGGTSIQKNLSYFATLQNYIDVRWHPLAHEAKKWARVEFFIENNGNFRYTIKSTSDELFRERIGSFLSSLKTLPPPKESVKIEITFKAKG